MLWEDYGINDQLPDDDLFQTKGVFSDSWYEHMLGFLIDGTMPENFSVDSKKEVCIKK